MQSLLPGWADAVHDAQASFRTIMAALSEPGIVRTMPVAIDGPAPLASATTAVTLTLADLDTPLWLDPALGSEAVRTYLRFHCGCPCTDAPEDAAFAIVAAPGSLSLQAFAQGSMEYPDRSSTLFVQVPALTGGPTRTLSGPGIAATRQLQVAGLPGDFDAQWRANGAGFPTGVDLIFCCGNQIVALPRTTRIFA